MGSHGETAHYLTLNEYTKLAKKIIKKYGKTFKQKLMRDEDAISHIVFKLAKADQNFNGFGVRSSYRVTNGIRGVRDMMRKYIRAQNKKTQTVSISDKNGPFSLEDLLEDNGTSVENKIFYQEIIDIIQNSNELSSTEKKIILWKYHECWSWQDIANTLKVTQSYIYFLRNTALLKLFGELYGRT